MQWRGRRRSVFSLIVLSALSALSAGCVTTQQAVVAPPCPDPPSTKSHPVSHSIAFTRFVDRGLPDIGGTTWLADPDGKNLRQLAGVSRTDTNPVWSPDGTRTAFTGRDAAQDQIYVIGSDGYDLVRLTCGTNDIQATWSPDGTRLLFAREDRPGRAGQHLRHER